MNGYSKMNIISKTKSRSMDISSDLLSPSSSLFETLNPKTETPETDFQQIKNNHMTTNNNSSSNNTQDSFSFAEQEDDYHQVYNNNNGEKFGHVKLSRNSSVSASASALQSAVKRAFSMGRSSSIVERYCRIHDQSVTLTSPIDDDDDFVVEMRRSRSVRILKKKNSSKSKILKACKKIFGL